MNTGERDRGGQTGGGKVKKVILIVLRITAIVLPVLLLLIVAAGVFGVKYLCVVSPSMEPELPRGSFIVVFPKDPASVSEGENLTYKAGDNYITHKVIKNDSDKRIITTRGIAGKLEDSPVAYENVIGVEKICIPGFGRFLAVFGTTGGKIVVMTVTTGIFLAVILIDVIGTRRRRAAAIQTDLTAEAADK